eukprot:6466993-Amphidinium_carterae.1
MRGVESPCASSSCVPGDHVQAERTCRSMGRVQADLARHFLLRHLLVHLSPLASPVGCAEHHLVHDQSGVCRPW